MRAIHIHFRGAVDPEAARRYGALAARCPAFHAGGIVTIGGRKFRIARVIATDAAWEASKHPRKGKGAGGGQFTAGAGGAGGAGEAAEPALDPKVVQVGGSEWNRSTAVRLEKDYVAAKPDIERLLGSLIGTKGGTVGEEDEDDTPHDWDSLTGTAQSDTEEQWKKDSYDEALKSEQDNWAENDAPHEAKQKIVYDFSDVGGAGQDWASDAIKDYLAERAEEDLPPIPYNEDQLLAATRRAGWPLWPSECAGRDYGS